MNVTIDDENFVLIDLYNPTAQNKKDQSSRYC